MTRSWCWSLAVLIGLCAFDPLAAYAQVPGAAPPPPGYGSPQPYPYQLPPGQPVGYGYAEEGDWYDYPHKEDHWLKRALAVDRVYFSTDYLNWSISDPGDVLLGAETRNPEVLRDGFDVFSGAGGTGTLLGRARVPTTENLEARQNNGLQALFGVDLLYGNSLEFSGFILDKSYDRDLITGLSEPSPANAGNGVYIATTFNIIGDPTDDGLSVYNNYFESIYRSQQWGAQANLILDWDRDGLLQFRPIVGFRYYQLEEQLFQRGLYSDPAGVADVLTTIDSQTRNSLYGPQLGFRSEIVTKWLTLGVEPKVGFMVNDQRAVVTSNMLRFQGDPLTTSVDDYTGFSAVVDIGLYGKVHLTENFSIRAGWNFLWVGRVARPENSIVYDDPGFGSLATRTVLMGARTSRHDIITDGLVIGGEWRF